MRHFVQYHKRKERGPYAKGQFKIVTGKLADSLVGDQVWIVEGDPPCYYLCEAFVVEDVGAAVTGAKHYEVSGPTGWVIDPIVPIQSFEWFCELQRATGNFAFGLQRINDKSIIQGFLGLLSGTKGRGRDDHY
jgi:hypothetical protein